MAVIVPNHDINTPPPGGDDEIVLSQEDAENFEKVCERIERGQSLRTIFIAGNLMSNTLFYRLIKEHPHLNERYARAKELYASDLFDEIIEIADESNADVVVDEKLQIHINGEAIQRSRLKIDARKWVLAKLEPKKYGDKIETEHSGEVGVVWKEEKTYALVDKAE